MYARRSSGIRRAGIPCHFVIASAGEAVEQVPDLLGLEYQRCPLQSIGHAAVFQGQLEALGQAFQRFCLWRLVDGHLPQLAVPGAVQLARFAKGLQLFGRAFDAAFGD